MERAGRNDPCPCGSGRKYKRCCQPHERERAAFFEALGTTALPLLSRLARFAESTAGAPLTEIARSAFPFWSGPLSKARGARVMDHLMFDFRPEGTGRRTIEQFAVDHAGSLDEPSAALLAAWSDAVRRPYRTTGWSGGFVTCVDLLTDATPSIDVYDIEESWRPADGPVVALRSLRAGAGWFCTGAPTAFPDRTADDVVEAVRRRHVDHVRSRRIVGMDDFLRVAPTALDEEAARGAAASSIILPGSVR